MIWLVILLEVNINIVLRRRKQMNVMIGIKRFSSNQMKLVLIKSPNKTKIT